MKLQGMVWRWRMQGHRVVYGFLERWDRMVTWRRKSRRDRDFPLLRWAEARDRLSPTLASATMVDLQRRLAGKLAGKWVIVIGSAPGIVLPEPQAEDRYVTVNGSINVAARLGITQITAHLLNSYSLMVSAERGGSRSLLGGLEAEELVVMTEPDHQAEVIELLKGSELRYGHLDIIDPIGRAAILLLGTGLHLGFGRLHERASSGMVVAALALAAGAREVVLAGFSLSGGHSYLSTMTKRDHLVGDRLFLAGVAEGRRVTTTNPKLAEIFGMPLRR